MHFLLQTYSAFLTIAEIVGMLWIQHPGVEKFFRYLGIQSGHFPSIKTLRKSDKKNLCASTIIAFSVITDLYNVSPSALEISSSNGFPLTNKFQVSNMLYAVLFPERFDNIEREYTKSLSNPSRDYCEVSVKVEGEVIAADALPCINYENRIRWYLTSGYVDDLYFTVEKSPEEDDCVVTGLLEPVPKQMTFCCDSVEKLESRYLEGLQKVVQTGRRTSLCKLDAFHKFRLCITVYATWHNRQHGVMANWYRVKDFNDRHETCKEAVHLSSRQEDHDRLMRVAPVDLVACSIEQDRNAPEFFVVADEFNLRSVFLVNTKLDEDSGKMKYFLSMHLTDVGALTNAMCDNLMVEL